MLVNPDQDSLEKIGFALGRFCTLPQLSEFSENLMSVEGAREID